ncbi:MAG TPA: prolyl oligopeptidase family serine peptidase [Polyangia bacterium]|nr:prolyl oligopeptidase family serine peptidase [Polyangia bacterium]
MIAAPMTKVALLGVVLAWGIPKQAGPAPAPAIAGKPMPETEEQFRAALGPALEAARARTRSAASVVREITMPSIERLIQDADARAASITVPERDRAFVLSNLARAYAYANAVAAGRDPYRESTGMIVKAYRAEWDGTLQPYALYVPPDYKPGRPGGWPLIVALHGAWSDHRHNLRRVFGLDNRPRENDAEASRNELPLPDVPALVVSPFGRGELMGYDGLGGDDVMRVIADVRRAYDVDPDRITLTGLSMGGDGTWQIGLRHPEMFAAIAPVCAVADFRRMIKPVDAGLFDADWLDKQSPAALAGNAAHMQVFIFHGDKDPTVPVADSRKMVERFRQLGMLGKNVHYTEYPGVGHNAWIPAYKDAGLLRALAAIKRDPTAPKAPVPPPPQCTAVPGLFGKSVPRQRPHIYVYGTHGERATVDAARKLANAMADWGPMVGARFAVKADSEVTADDRKRFSLVLIGSAPFNALDDSRPRADVRPLGDRAFRALEPDTAQPGGCMLVLGAETPRGLERLTRFARFNRDGWGPEPNRPFAILAD